LAELSSDDVPTLERMTDLTAETGEWALSRQYALRWLAVSPMQPEPHRKAARAAERLDDFPLLIETGRSLLALDPLDPAGVHLQLATALQQTGDLSAARRHALYALEEAPRFRAAQQRLLEIVRLLDEQEREAQAKSVVPGDGARATDGPDDAAPPAEATEVLP
jgi:tetratricopeptide (TPR) repeat protein